jgi:ribonuclease HI
MKWEAIALLCAMEEVCERGFVRVQFESDSQLLVDAIRLKQIGNFEFILSVARHVN